MELSLSQKQFLLENGYVKIPGVVPRVAIDTALRAINHSLGEGISKEEIAKFRAQSYCPEINTSDAITGLINHTPAFHLIESLIGRGKLNPRKNGQIALRFPGFSKVAQPKIVPHVDGIWSKDNGVPEGRMLNFTMNACVLLSDVTEPYSGNFTVWPGSHLRIAAHIKEHGPESLMQGMPAIDTPAEQITGKAGDLVLAHYLLGHTAAPNLAFNIRYAIFYRVTPNDRPPVPEKGPDRRDALLDPWLEWPGLK